MEIITGIIGFIALITFFVMAVALSNISTNLKEINKIITAWSKATEGYGITYQCANCNKKYEGKQLTCPKCGKEKDYS